MYLSHPRYLNLANPSILPPHAIPPCIDDQIPSRVVAGMIPLNNIFGFIELIVTEEQRSGRGNPTRMLREIESRGARVLGPNIGEEIFKRQDMISPDLQGQHMLFLGEMCRTTDRELLCARGLYWGPDGKLRWDGEWFDPRVEGWCINAQRKIVVLKEGAQLVYPSA